MFLNLLGGEDVTGASSQGIPGVGFVQLGGCDNGNSGSSTVAVLLFLFVVGKLQSTQHLPHQTKPGGPQTSRPSGSLQGPS